MMMEQTPKKEKDNYKIINERIFALMACVKPSIPRLQHTHSWANA